MHVLRCEFLLSGSQHRSTCAGGHILHLGSTLGQLNGINLKGVQAYIRGAKSVQELIDMPYPADELAEVIIIYLPPRTNVAMRECSVVLTAVRSRERATARTAPGTVRSLLELADTSAYTRHRNPTSAAAVCRIWIVQGCIRACSGSTFGSA